MDEATGQLVRRRAGNRCEYCRVPQKATPFIPFHIEHMTEHFLTEGGEITGLTPTGRATVRLLNMNAPRRVQLRDEWYDVALRWDEAETDWG
jgi:hypothetical protein